MSHSSPRRLFFWCCKPLGLRTLRHLLDWQEIFHEFTIVGVGINTHDSWHEEIAELAKEYEVPVYSDSEADTSLTIEADIGLIIGYPRRITAAVLTQFPHGIINLHFAPLPNYRGSGTLEQAIINREKKYGVTLHYIDKHLDTGPVIAVRWMHLPTDQTAEQIIPQLEHLAFEFLTEYLPKLFTHQVEATSQAELIQTHQVKPKFCSRRSIEKLYVLDPSWSFEKLYRYVRALSVNSSKRPYLQSGDRRIYLSIT